MVLFSIQCSPFDIYSKMISSLILGFLQLFSCGTYEIPVQNNIMCIEYRQWDTIFFKHKADVYLKFG